MCHQFTGAGHSPWGRPMAPSLVIAVCVHRTSTVRSGLVAVLGEHGAYFSGSGKFTRVGFL